MQHKKIFFTLVISIFLSLPALAQVNTYSPYSRFGLGELALEGFGRNISMGSTGIGLRSNTSINYINPASYSAIDTMSFLFDFGFDGSRTIYQSNDLDYDVNNMNIHHIGIGFPITPWLKAGAGIMPFSHVGYNIVDEQSDPEIGLIDYNFEGNGGLNKFFIGASVDLFNHFSVGTNMSYMFGYINNAQRINFPGANYYAILNIEDRLIVRDILFNFGLQYHETFNERYFLNLGVIYDHESALSTSQTLLQENYFPGTASQINDSTIIDPIYTLAREENEGNIIYPRRLGFGFSAGIQDRLIFSADYSMQNWNDSRLMGKNDSLVNSSSIKGGFEVTPDPEALRGYFNRVHYRLGGYYTNSYLRIRGEQLKDYGITFGLGLPLRGTKTTFNLGVILGQRGTIENNLIKESYGIINLSFTFHDIWFFERKFD